MLTTFERDGHPLANRGIGLGLVRELIRRGGCSVVATCRSPAAPGAAELRALLEGGGQGRDGCRFMFDQGGRGGAHNLLAVPKFPLIFRVQSIIFSQNRYISSLNFVILVFCLVMSVTKQLKWSILPKSIQYSVDR